MENPLPTLVPRLSIILCVRPSIADLAGVQFPPVGPLTRKAEVERSVASVLKELNSVMDPVGAELVVVDAESPEDVAGHLRAVFAEEIMRGKLQVATCPPTVDQGRMRNVGAQKAQGTWLTFLEPGDCYLPGRLNHLQLRLQGADLILGYDGTEVPPRADWIRTLISGELPPERFIPGAAVVKRTLFEKVGGYLEGRLGQLIDHELWVRVLLELRSQHALDRLLVVPSADIERGSKPPKPIWLREGQHALTLVGGLPKLPLSLWPAALRRVVGFLLNR